MNEKKARGLLAAAMSTAMFVSSTAGAVPVLANDAAGSQVQSDSTPELVPQPQSVAYAGGERSRSVVPSTWKEAIRRMRMQSPI